MNTKSVTRKILAFCMALVLAAGGLWTFAPSADFTVMGLSLGESNPYGSSSGTLGGSSTHGQSGAMFAPASAPYAAGKYTTVSALGGTQENILHYNGIALGNLVGKQADVEGFLAVGGDAVLGRQSPSTGFDVGGAAAYGQLAGNISGSLIKKDPGFPAFLLGGELDLQTTNSWSSVYGDIVASLGTTFPNNFDTGYTLWGKRGSKYYADQKVIDSFFDVVGRYAVGWTEYLATADKSNVDYSFSTAGFTITSDMLAKGKLNSYDEDISVITMRLSDNSSAIPLHNLYSDGAIKNYDLVVINILNDEVYFSGQIFSTDVASKIIWNFPNASYISIYNPDVKSSAALNGSVIAPYAHVSGYGGAINGRVLCNDLTLDNGFELHNHKPDISIPDLDNGGGGDGDGDGDGGDGGGSTETGGAYFKKIADTNSNSDGIPLPIDNVPIEGAVFEVDRWINDKWEPITVLNGTMNKQWTSDVSGLVEITGLEIGILHRLREVSVPYGYDGYIENVNREIATFTPELNSNKNMVDLGRVKNNSIWFGFLVHTYQKEPLTEARVQTLDHIRFAVYYSVEGSKRLDADSWTYWYTLDETGTDGAGNIHFKLPYARGVTYRLEEEHFPYNLEYDDRYETGIIDLTNFELLPFNTQRFPVAYVMDDDPGQTALGQLTVRKYRQDDTSAPLANATFQLYEVINEVRTATESYRTTNDKGEALFISLSEGTYWVKEVAAPSGYQLPQGEGAFTGPFRVNSQGEVIYNGETIETVSIANVLEEEAPPPPTKQVTLRKVNRRGSPLTGAVFSLEQQEEDGSWTLLLSNVPTDENGEITYTLPYGVYRLWEVDAPDGYILSSGSTIFVIDEYTREDYSYKYYNDPIVPGATYGEVTIIKYKTGSQSDTLAGAEFKLQKLTGAEVWSDYTHGLVTDSEGVIYLDALPIGTYQLVEVKAPEGYYMKLDTYEFTISESNTTNSFTFYVPNSPVSTDGGNGGGGTTTDNREKPGSNTPDNHDNNNRQQTPSVSAETPQDPPPYSTEKKEAHITSPDNPSTGFSSVSYLIILGMVFLGIVIPLLYKNREKYD